MPHAVDFRDLPETVLLQSFCAVAQTRSMTRAAELAGRSQPAISLHLQKLEAQLGTKLVSRKQRPLVLTKEGEMLAKVLPSLLGRLSKLVDQVQSSEEATRHTLRIAMPDSMSSAMGAEFVSLAGKLADSVELCAGITPWEQDVFRALQIDLLVDSPPFDPREYAHPLEIFCDPYVVISPARTQGMPVQEIIAAEPQVAHAKTTKFGQRSARIAASLGAEGSPKYNFDTTQSILRFVQIGYGWAVTSVLCLFQSPGVLKDIELHSIDAEHHRTLMLLGRTQELAPLAEETATIMRRVCKQLANGPWAEKSEQATALLRAANPDIFAASGET